VGHWPSVKARDLYAALIAIGWRQKHEQRTGGSHVLLARPGWPDFPFAFHPGTEIGPKMLARVAKQTGLKREDL